MPQRQFIDPKSEPSPGGLRWALHVGLALWLALPQAAFAATITADGTTCTLANAITAANTDSASSGCSAGAGADTIEMTSGVSLSLPASGVNAFPPVTSEITINANDLSISRVGGSNFRLFRVDTNGTLTLNDATVSGGDATDGGAFYISGGGQLTLNRSTLSGNTAAYGGAIHLIGADSHATIDSSTLSGNTAYFGSAVYANAGTTATLTNSTVSGNNATGDATIFVYGTTVTLSNSTITENTGSGTYGGLYGYSGGTSKVYDSIVDNNDGVDCTGIDNASARNFGDGTCGASFSALSGLNDTLADNGGPTFTHALFAGSSALDSNTDCSLTVDQRGVARDDGACDAGAFELRAPIVADGSTCTLVDAVTSANSDSATGGCTAGSGSDRIELTAGATLTTVNNSGGNGDNGLPIVTSPIIVDGGGFTVDRDAGAPSFRFFDVASGGSLTLQDLTLSNGAGLSGGAAQVYYGDLVLDNVALVGNSALLGGAITLESSSLTMTDSTISGNTAGDSGGGIHSYSLVPIAVSVTNSTISGNTASGGSGGGIYSSNYDAAVQLVITNSTISGNSSFGPGGGGGVYLSGASGLSATLTHTTVLNNFASGSGGLTRVGAATFDLTNSIVAGHVNPYSSNPPVINCTGGGFVDNGGNLSDSDDCGAGFLPVSGVVSVLRDNGGPTLTHALRFGSSAIGGAGTCGLAADQRGFARGDGACDSGAFEAPQPIIVDNVLCTLVDAVNSANGDTAVAGCSAGFESDTIILTDDVTLEFVDNAPGNGANGTPVVTSSVTVEGQGHTIERDPGALQFRFFDVASSGTLALHDAVLSGGASLDAGGAIRVVGGEAYVYESTLKDNWADYGGAVGLSGGGIASIVSSTLSGNYAYSGGGIRASTGASLFVTNSTISGNIASGIGGGGLAVYIPATATLANTTIAGNESPFGSYGANLQIDGAVTVDNVVVANPIGNPNCEINTPMTDTGGNLDDDGTCGAGFATLTGFDPILRDNGGPTETHRLAFGSSAIDAGGVCALTLDQRGIARNDSGCDSGAFELALIVISVVPPDNSLDVVTGANVTLEFSRPLDPSTVNDTNILLLDPTGTPVDAEVSLAPGGTTVTLDPDDPLGGNPQVPTTYEIVVTPAVEDVTGIDAESFSSFFETAALVPEPTLLEDAAEQTTIPSPPPSPPPFGPPAAASLGAGDELGFAVAGAGDLNGDGIQDLIGGAPGYANNGGVIVAFGSVNSSERESADIIYVGETSGDRAGNAVAGGFLFDGDQTPDLLIGANGASGDEGRVYVIYFRPLDYDADGNNIPDYQETTCSNDRNQACVDDNDCGGPSDECDIAPVFVDLARVGVPGHVDGGVAGLVMDGVPGGAADDVGFAVAGRGQMSGGATSFSRLDGPNLPDDVAIGAPGADGGVGRVYVLFGQSQIGRFPITDVGVSLAGLAINGPGPAVERFGAALALPGDVTGSPGHDLAIGAPDASPGQSQAGRVYVVEGGALAQGSMSASTIAARVEGTAEDEQLGFAVGAAGDNRADDATGATQFDLLIGAPGYDSNKGRAVQISERLPPTNIAVSDVGAPGGVPGIVWLGTDTDGKLGYSVGSLGDVTGNGFVDIGIGAPFADHPSTAAAGKIYLIEGLAVGTDTTGDEGGEVLVDKVGGTHAGTVLRGTQANERAGLVMADVGNLDGDADDEQDFTVGSPGWSGEAGTIHQVVETRLPLPGECIESSGTDCVAAHVMTGARLKVPTEAMQSGAIVQFEAEGLMAFPVAGHLGCTNPQPGDCDDGLGLAGVADFNPDVEEPTLPALEAPVEIDVPIFSRLEYQLALNEELTLMYCDNAGGWIDDTLAPTAVVSENRHVLGGFAARATVEETRLWAVFFQDQDCDQVQDSCDCNDDSPAWAPPGPPTDLHYAINDQTGLGQFRWIVPEFTGGAEGSMQTDFVRSLRPCDFENSPSVDCENDDRWTDSMAICIPTNGGWAVDLEDPAPNETFYYAVRTTNDCNGTGPNCCQPGETDCIPPPPPQRSTLSCAP
ncbi:MAG: hypothetical protein GY716_14625 [bacterium]|nr:hypothetical protein [bacterium]